MRPEIGKSVAAVAGVTGAAALGWSLWSGSRPRDLPYKVISQEDGFEVRTYRPSIVVCTDVTSGYEAAMAEGRRRLLSYLNGENETGGRFTTIPPVLEERVPQGTRVCWRLSFTLKEHLPYHQMPQPTDERVELVPQGIHTYGALQFSGPVSERRLEQKKQELLDAISRSTWKITGTDPMLAEFSSHGPLPLMKRNELMIAVGR